MVIQEVLGSRQTVLPKASITDAVRIGAHLFLIPGKLSRTDRYSSMPKDVNSAVATARLNSPITSSNSTSISPAQTRRQEIISPMWSIIAKRAKNADPLNVPIKGFVAVHGHSTSILRKVIDPKNSLEKAPTSTRAKVWTSQVIPSSAKFQTSLIWGYHPPTQRIHSRIDDNYPFSITTR